MLVGICLGKMTFFSSKNSLVLLRFLALRSIGKGALSLPISVTDKIICAAGSILLSPAHIVKVNM